MTTDHPETANAGATATFVVRVGLTDEIPPPYLLLLVSGGHTQLLLVDSDFLLVTGDTPSGDPGSVAGRPPATGPGAGLCRCRRYPRGS